jgi:hypothetical protein
MDAATVRQARQYYGVAKYGLRVTAKKDRKQHRQQPTNSITAVTKTRDDRQESMLVFG